MRFWEHADIGVQAEGPQDLVPAVTMALVDPPLQQARREAIVAEVYERTDGRAAWAAAAAIAELCR
jgi:hypothetical protein